MNREVHHKQLTPRDAAIVLVDHQPGVLAMAGSLPADVVTRNASTLARLGEELDVPLVITSTRETLEFLGTNLKSIQEAAPKAYAARVRRSGTLNAFDDPAFVSALKATKRQHLVMAGLTSDVCLFHSVVSALQAGYHVYVVVDASSSGTERGDSATYDRLQNLGAILTTTYGILFELFPDLSKPEGQRAEAVAASGMNPQ